MNDEERKQKFIALLEELLLDFNGEKTNLANKLGIQPSTLTRWFQGQIDPATIELTFFVRLAETVNISTDQLVDQLYILEKSEETILDKFKILVRDLLSTQTQKILANKLGVSEGAVGTWIRKQRTVDPRKISIATIAAIAREKNWTIERLLIYLDLKKTEPQNNLFFKVQSNANVLPLNDQVKLLAWLSDQVQKKFVEDKTINKIVNNATVTHRQNDEDRTLLIILEQENMAIASNYLQKLYVHTNINPENITIRVADPSFARGATIQNLPDAINNYEILIFDISSPDSPSIALIQDISFDGDIVVFVPESLPDNVQAGLEDKVTDLVIKPIDWSSLRDKEYFR